MSELFFPVTIKKIIRETSDASTFVLDIPAAYKDKFKYLPGQYITFRTRLDGEEVRRAYSFCSSPEIDPDPAVTIKKVEDGKFSVYMNDRIKEGDVIEVMPPLGRFVLNTNALSMNHYVLFAGGSGVTPIMSIAKTVLQKELFAKISVIYCNRNEESIIFKDAFDEMVLKYAPRIEIRHCLDIAGLGFTGFSGRPGIEDFKAFVTDIQSKSALRKEYYICGPSGMMDNVKKALQEMNTPAEQIHTEYFAAPVKSSSEEVKVEKPHAADEQFEFCEAEITIGSKTTKVVIQKGTTVLDAAKKADLDPPYACEMGVCTTCRGKVYEGGVEMDEREGLTDDEIAKGYVLTCQSHPTTSKLKLKYE